MASLAQVFEATVGKPAAVSIVAFIVKGSNFMQHPFIYPATAVQSASFTQVAGKVATVVLVVVALAVVF